MSITIDGGAGITFPDTVQQTNGMTMTGGNPLYYAARAWVNFKGTSPAAIRASSNVASVTRNTTGTYTITFTTPMPDANYAVVGSARRGGVNTRGIAFEISPDVALTTSSVQVRTVSVDTSPAVVDCEDVYVVVFR
jgi:hypothetical protein